MPNGAQKNHMTSIEAASRSLWKTLGQMQKVWLAVYGEELVIHSKEPRAGVDEAIVRFKERLAQPEDRARIEKAVGVELDNSVPESDDEVVAAVVPKSGKGVIRDVDDLTPNQVRSAMWVTVALNAPDEGEPPNDIEVPDFLRQTLREIWHEEGLTGRINVGANKHWPRLWEYLWETEADLERDGVRYMQIMNVGRGRVAEFPEDPRRLRVRIRGGFF